MKHLIILFLGFSFHAGFTQPVLHGVVADSISGKVLPFATIRSGSRQNAVIAGIDGHFAIPLYPGVSSLTVSYVGYSSKNIPTDYFKLRDTLFLRQSTAALEQITVIPQTGKIRRILQNAIRNKPLHNPEFYDNYQCDIYYKMYADLLPAGPVKYDSTAGSTISYPPVPGKSKGKFSKTDSGFFKYFLANNHLIFAETYSRRNY